ncbi:hypothetical protein TIFTF001_029927 [Ficus carica]|uniref:Uncharacterized protein n=1 Tax=Ficus carica TaxID=3494 RepID=A0AA88DSA2_FICCA|nr:hypothetical protein TIFTF001_029927 [Ficus carica]
MDCSSSTIKIEWQFFIISNIEKCTWEAASIATRLLNHLHPPHSPKSDMYLKACKAIPDIMCHLGVNNESSTSRQEA